MAKKVAAKASAKKDKKVVEAKAEEHKVEAQVAAPADVKVASEKKAKAKI